MQLSKTVQPLTSGGQQWSMNQLLASLPADDYQRVSSELTWRPLKVRQVLHKHGEPLAEVYFPGRSVCSVTNVMEDGSVVEVATVGREGLVGIRRCSVLRRDGRGVRADSGRACGRHGHRGVSSRDGPARRVLRSRHEIFAGVREHADAVGRVQRPAFRRTALLPLASDDARSDWPG